MRIRRSACRWPWMRVETESIRTSSRSVLLEQYLESESARVAVQCRRARADVRFCFGRDTQAGHTGGWVGGWVAYIHNKISSAIRSASAGSSYPNSLVLLERHACQPHRNTSKCESVSECVQQSSRSPIADVRARLGTLTLDCSVDLHLPRTLALNVLHRVSLYVSIAESQKSLSLSSLRSAALRPIALWLRRSTTLFFLTSHHYAFSHHVSRYLDVLDPSPLRAALLSPSSSPSSLATLASSSSPSLLRLMGSSPLGRFTALCVAKLRSVLRPLVNTRPFGALTLAAGRMALLTRAVRDEVPLSRCALSPVARYGGMFAAPPEFLRCRTPVDVVVYRDGRGGL
jgi:hypothetical protein